MSDFDNNAKRAPWTQDPEVVKAIWGENAQASTKSFTASTRLTNLNGSLWPTEQELAALNNNAMPSAHTLTKEEIKIADNIVRPMHKTPVLNPLDNAQSLIDSVLGSRTNTTMKAVLSKDPTKRVPLFMDEGDLAKVEAEDDMDFGPDDGRNNIDDYDFLTDGYDINAQEADDEEGIESETKEKIPSAKRKKLSDSDFVLSSERKFPVTTPKGVMQAVNSWGRYEGKTSFDTFKRNLISLAHRKGFTNALPKKWQKDMKSEKSFNNNAIVINIEDSPFAKRLKEVSAKMQAQIDRNSKA
jgi:hypothetical protein